MPRLYVPTVKSRVPKDEDLATEYFRKHQHGNYGNGTCIKRYVLKDTKQYVNRDEKRVNSADLPKLSFFVCTIVANLKGTTMTQVKKSRAPKINDARYALTSI